MGMPPIKHQVNVGSTLSRHNLHAVYDRAEHRVADIHSLTSMISFGRCSATGGYRRRFTMLRCAYPLLESGVGADRATVTAKLTPLTALRIPIVAA
jgi:hypothetical protein